MTIFNYTVNYIDVAVVGVFVLFAFLGYHRGLIINIVNFIRYSVGLFLCFYISENFYMTLYNNYVKVKALAYLNEKVVTSANIDENIKNLQEIGKGLPDFITDTIRFQSINISSENVAESILNNVLEPVLLFISKAAIFLAVFVVFFLITGIILLVVQKAGKKADEKRGKKSVLKKTDKALGAVLGLLKAFVIVLAFTSVMMYILNLADGADNLSPFMAEVHKSTLIKLINEMNPFNAVTEGLI